MKSLPAIVLVTASVCFAGDQSAKNAQEQGSDLRVEHHEWLAEYGETRYHDEFYRGNQRILRVVKFQNEKTKTWEIWRFYYIDGKTVMFEDDKGDGKQQTLSLIKDNLTYDEFVRKQDGSLAPVSSEELAKIKEGEQRFAKDAGKFTDILAAQIATNSTGNVTQMVKEAVQQFKSGETSRGKQ